MPSDFLGPEHIVQYGQFTVDPSPEELAQFFRLSEDELALVVVQYEPYNRLGMALQLVTLKYKGTFLPDPTVVPKVVVRFVAEQLGIRDTRILRQYLGRRQTRFDHAKVLRERLGYREFDALEAFHLRRFLYAKLLVADERPIRLFDECTRELVTRRVVLPGATTLARLVAEVRERVSTRLYSELSRRLSEEQKRRLGDLLVLPEPGVGRKTTFDQLRTPPTRTTAPALVAALERVETIRAVGVSEVGLADVPESRLTGLVKYAAVAWAGQLAKLNRDRCHATMLAYLQYLEKSAADDALDIFDSLMSSLNLKSQRRWRRERLRSLGNLDSSALLLREAVVMLLDPTVSDAEVRKAVFGRISDSALREAVTQIATLA